MIDESYVQEGAVVIDVGINVDENGHLCGDVDFDAISSVASVRLPYRGIGNVTTAVLARRLVNAPWLRKKPEVKSDIFRNKIWKVKGKRKTSWMSFGYNDYS